MGNSPYKNGKVSVEKIVDMIGNDKYGDIRGFLLNLLLVKCGGRKAYLFECSEFKDIMNASDIKRMLNIPSEIGLILERDVLSLDDYPRYWVFKDAVNIPESHEEIGELLGMKDPGGDFFNYRNDRITLIIYEETTETGMTTELVLGDIKENEEFAERKIDMF